jgi:EAL domain-containing protein (putative c-di-GMP-specific phosphodiesterase class I)
MQVRRTRRRPAEAPGSLASEGAQDGLDLVAAIANRQLRLWYQPIISLDDDQVVGVEALVRWQHTERGMLPPAAFIPQAERSDLIVDVGRWVLDEACHQAAEWRSRGRRLQVSVNVGARHVEDCGLVTDVLGALECHGLDPSALCLEITETVPMQASDGALARLRDLRRRGVRIALDDFGTGCSSLATLVRVEIDELKVDRLFVEGLQADDQANHALVTAVLGLASTLGLDVVAEGIETAAQLRELRALGCPFGQGYLYQRPLPADELEAWVHQRARQRAAMPPPRARLASPAPFSRRGDRSGPTTLRCSPSTSGRALV